MIRSIPRIISFGVFADFHWHAGIPQFKQYNLIYGWNYSGKTTLARVFRCFELKQPHADFADAQVQLKADDGVVHHLSSPDTAPTFRVFNTDFIRDNRNRLAPRSMPRRLHPQIDGSGRSRQGSLHTL